ncbi:MAG TPA: group II truncated hemoglobin [Phycisphaerales bacterium]|nr:group II truncated hemoglobin [Phycisphaerales bacterium]
MLQSSVSKGDGEEKAFGPENLPYEAIGGEVGVRGLVECFYDHMERDAEFAGIRRLHPEEMRGSREKLFMFLSGWLGGPDLYVKQYGHPKLRARHMPFAIGEQERDQWLTCMGRAMDERGIGGALRDFLNARFAHVADFMRNKER